jgi:hypothetical protein
MQGYDRTKSSKRARILVVFGCFLAQFGRVQRRAEAFWAVSASRIRDIGGMQFDRDPVLWWPTLAGTRIRRLGPFDE